MVNVERAGNSEVEDGFDLKEGSVMKTTTCCIATILSVLMFQPVWSHADTVYITTPTADAFLAAGSATNPVCTTNCASLNFGGTGNLAVSSASSVKGEFDTVIKFNMDGAVNQFNSTYGAGNWQVTGISLNLNSNFGTQGAQPSNLLFNSANGGNFNVQWISNNSWVEGTNGGVGGAGGVTFNSIPTLLSGATASLGTFTYTLPGANNVYVMYNLPLNSNLVSNVNAGGDLSLFLTPADDQIGYLMAARSAGMTNPQFIVTAAPVPVPAALWLFGSGLAAMAGWARRKMK